MDKYCLTVTLLNNVEHSTTVDDYSLHWVEILDNRIYKRVAPFDLSRSEPYEYKGLKGYKFVEKMFRTIIIPALNLKIEEGRTFTWSIHKISDPFTLKESK